MKHLTLLNPSNLNPNMKLFHQYLRRKFVSFGTKYNNKVQVINVLTLTVSKKINQAMPD
jgi:hypothetical protein